MLKAIDFGLSDYVKPGLSFLLRPISFLPIVNSLFFGVCISL